jgi:hypothetical protein
MSVHMAIKNRQRAPGVSPGASELTESPKLVVKLGVRQSY